MRNSMRNINLDFEIALKDLAIAYSDLLEEYNEGGKMDNFDIYNFCVRWENDELEDEDELVRGFQVLINNGMAWTLQGRYGRMAVYLINLGYCERRK